MRREPQDSSGFLHVEAPEEAHFDDAGLTRVELRQGGKGVVERDELMVAGGAGVNGFVELEVRQVAAAFAGGALARGIHKDSPHGLAGDREEVRAILPVDRGAICEMQPGFVDERGGLHGVARFFAPHVASGNAPQFVIDQGSQAVEGCFVPLAPRPKEARDSPG